MVLPPLPSCASQQAAELTARLPMSVKAILFSFSLPQTPRTETKITQHYYLYTNWKIYDSLLKKIDKYVVCWELKIRRKAGYWQRLPWVSLERGWIIGCSWRQPRPPPPLLLETARENQLSVALQQEERLKQINVEFAQRQALLL